jgi:Autographiviridae endonuclease VII
LRRYGITLEALARLLHEQDGRCAICRRPWQSCKPVKRARDEGLFLHHLCVDHDHESGRVRGLLCNACNTGIGVFEEDPARLLNAVAYVQSSFADTGRPFADTCVHHV